MEKHIGQAVNQNDIFLYFEIINRIEPESVLDIGMFLKQIGALTRQVKDEAFEATVMLDGVDAASNISAEIYKTVYNHIYTPEEFYEIIEKADETINYELAVMLKTKKMFCDNDEKLIKWLSSHVKYFITDLNCPERIKMLKEMGRFRDLEVNEDIYGLIEFM